MIYTGRILTVAVSVILTVIHLFIFKEHSGKELIDFLVITSLAYFLGGQYDRIKLEERRREENAESYRQLVELLPEAVFIHEDESILYVNKAGEELLAASGKSELIGKSIYTFIQSDYQKLLIQHIKQVYKEKMPVMTTEKELTCLDGRVVPCGVSSLFMTFQEKKLSCRL